MLYQPDVRQIVNTTTCQICGRPIKAKNGIIAHHGYKRPGGGWQTASCDGARQYPYEDARDQLPRSIAKAKRFIAEHQAWLDEFITNPPEVLIYSQQRYVGVGRYKTESIELPRPDGFSSDGARRPYGGHDYAYEYDSRVRETKQRIKWAKEDIAVLTKRFDNWQPAWLPADPMVTPF